MNHRGVYMEEGAQVFSIFTKMNIQGGGTQISPPLEYIHGEQWANLSIWYKRAMASITEIQILHLLLKIFHLFRNISLSVLYNSFMSNKNTFDSTKWHFLTLFTNVSDPFISLLHFLIFPLKGLCEKSWSVALPPIHWGGGGLPGADNGTDPLGAAPPTDRPSNG